MNITIGLPTLESGYVGYVTETNPLEVDTVPTDITWIKPRIIETVSEYYHKAMKEDGWEINQFDGSYFKNNGDFKFGIAPRENVIDKIFPLRTTILGVNFKAIESFKKHVYAITAIKKYNGGI